MSHAVFVSGSHSRPSDDFAPLWSPDGSRIIYSSRRRQGTIHLYEKASSGSGKEQLVLRGRARGSSRRTGPTDGRFVAFIGGGGIVARSDIWVLSLSGERKARLHSSRAPFARVSRAVLAGRTVDRLHVR